MSRNRLFTVSNLTDFLNDSVDDRLEDIESYITELYDTKDEDDAKICYNKAVELIQEVREILNLR